MSVMRWIDDGGEAPEALAPRRRRSRHAPQRTSRGDAVQRAVVLVSQVGFHTTGMPWWAFCLMSALWVGPEYLRSVIPQESLHKLAWWSERRETRRQNRRQDMPGDGDHRGS